MRNNVLAARRHNMRFRFVYFSARGNTYTGYLYALSMGFWRPNFNNRTTCVSGWNVSWKNFECRLWAARSWRHSIFSHCAQVFGELASTSSLGDGGWFQWIVMDAMNRIGSLDQESSIYGLHSPLDICTDCSCPGSAFAFALHISGLNSNQNEIQFIIAHQSLQRK